MIITFWEMSLAQQLCNCCARDKRHENGSHVEPMW
jgi:hypothetical protein